MTYQKIIKVLGLPDGSVRQSSAEKNKIFFVLYLTHPHVCRHTYCSNMAKLGMNPKTLQYLMGHSDISVTMNVYTHIGFDDAEEELKRMEEFQKAQAEIDKKNDAKAVSQKMFKVVQHCYTAETLRLKWRFLIVKLGDWWYNIQELFGLYGAL